MDSWKTLSKRSLLKHSKFLEVESHTIQLPDGRILDDWPWLVMPDYVNVVALTEEGKMLCFRQTKYSVDGTSLAPIGGYLELGEDPLAAARRELREETGYEAGNWTSLGCYHVDANRGAGKAYFFLAQGARWVGQIYSDDLEEQVLLLLTPPEVQAALSANEFKVLSWAAAIAMALLKLGQVKDR